MEVVDNIIGGECYYDDAKRFVTTQIREIFKNKYS